MQDIMQQIRTEIRGSWRYRWTAMITAWLVCLIGWVSVFSMPDIYQAQAQVYVDADSRLADVMGQVGVDPSVGSRVFIVRQAMLGRPQLERVAADTGLDARATTEIEMESLLMSLSEKISIGTGRNAQARNLYTISFEDRDRVMAVSVVQTLLDAFVEDVLELKDRGTADVTSYLDEQLTYYSTQLSESETKLAEFKKKYVGLLPGESGGIFETMQIELDTLKQLRLDLRTEIDRRNELRRQLDTGEPMLPDGAEDVVGVAVPGTASQASITELETRRADLLLGFTEKHPDVVAIDEQLAQLYEKRRQERIAMRNSGTGIEGAANSTNPVYQTAQIALNNAKVAIAGLQSEIAQREAAVRRLNASVDTIPEIEAEHAQLTRDYAQHKSLYDDLLLEREKIRLGSAGDERDVVSFNIVEPPAATFEPVAPKRGLLIMMTLVAGLAIGAGVAFVFHQLNPVFHNVSTLRRISGRPILGAVSMTWLERGQKRRSVDFSSFAAVGVGLIALFVCILAFQDIGVELIHGLFRQSQG